MKTVFFYQITQHPITKDNSFHCPSPQNLRTARINLCEAYGLIILYKYIQREWMWSFQLTLGVVYAGESRLSLLVTSNGSIPGENTSG